MAEHMAVPGGSRGALALKRWVANSHLSIIPVSQDDTLFAKEIRYFTLHVHEILGVQIPAGILKARDSVNDRLGVRFNLSLYNAKSQTFFGRTHESPVVWFENNKDVRYDVRLDHFIYFASPIYDDNCYGVAEIQLIHENNKTGVKRSYAMGWTTVRIFKDKNIVDIEDEEDDEEDFSNQLSLFDGSPRALLTMSASDINNKQRNGTKWQRRSGKFAYSLSKMQSLERAAHLFKPHDLIGTNNPVGGLEMVEYQSTEGPFLYNKKNPSKAANIKLAPRMELEIKGVVVKLPKLIDNGIKRALEKGFEGGNSVERTLRVSLHNGHRVFAPQSGRRGGRSDWKNGFLKVELSNKSSRSKEIYRAEDITIPHYCKDSNVAIVFQIVYNVNGGPDAVVAEAIFVPFDGKKYLHGITTTYGKNQKAEILVVPCVRGSMISPNGFTGGVTASSSSPDIYDYDVEQITPSVSCEIEVDEPDHVQAKTRKKEKEKKKLLENYERELSEDKAEKARRKKMEELEAKNKKKDKKKKKKAKDDSDIEISSGDDTDDDDEDSFKKKKGKKSKFSDKENDRYEEVEDRNLQSKSAVLGGDNVVHGLPRGSNDILMRSLLAQSLKQPLKKPGMGGVATINAQLGSYNPGVTAVIGGTTPLATQLTRASKTYLARHGYTDVLGDSTSIGGVKRVPLPSRRQVDLDVEFSDTLLANEVTFQFAAFRTIQGLNIPQPRAVHFTFQFFNNYPTRTEHMVLSQKNRGALLSERKAGSISEPMILVREDTDGRVVPSLAYSYIVDNSLVPGETRLFPEYLKERTLYIEVWDSDSLLKVGTIAVELAGLLRQGEKVIKSALEYDIISSSADEIIGEGIPTVQARALPAGRVTGRVQLLMSNYGLEGKGPYSELKASSAAAGGFVERGKEIFGKTEGDRDWRVGARTGFDNLNNSISGNRVSARHRSRAVPLPATNPELKSLLSSRQKEFSRTESQGRNNGKTTSMAAKKKGGWKSASLDSGVRALTDPFSISMDELDSLYGFCSAGKSATGKIDWSVFVKDICNGTGISGRGTGKGGNKKRFEPAVDRLESRLRKILRGAEDKGLDIEDVFEEFDEDGDGKITEKEFKHTLKKLGFHATDKDMKHFMARFAHRHGENTIDAKSFIDFAMSPSSSLKSNIVQKVEKRLKKIIVKAEEKGMKIKDIFAHFDKNNDGRITRAEWMDALEDLGIKINEEEAEAVLLHLDENHDGRLTINEFVDFVMGDIDTEDAESKIDKMENRLRKILKKAKDKGLSLRDAFSEFDRDNRGIVDDRDFEAVLADLGFKGAHWELDALVKRFDTNGDGYVSIDEFVDFANSAPNSSRYKKAGRGGSVPVRMEAVKEKCSKAYGNCTRSGKDVNSMFQAFDRGTGNVTRTEFKYVLMDMGLSLMDDRDYDDEDDIRASTIQRQMARLDNWRKRDGSNSKRSSRASDIIGKEHANKGKFAIHKEQLDLVKRFRDTRKKALVGRLLKSSISNELTIYPSFARAKYFEYELRNPYSCEAVFVIELPAQSELRVVRDRLAQEHYRRVLQPAAGKFGDKPVEDEMIDEDLHLTLEAGESVFIPFVFLSFNSGSVMSGRGKGKAKYSKSSTAGGKAGEKSDDSYGSKNDDSESKEDFSGAHGNGGDGVPIMRRTIPVRFFSKNFGHTVMVLQVHVRPRPFIVDRTFRFNQAENEYLKRSIAIHPRNFNPYNAAPALMPGLNNTINRSKDGATGVINARRGQAMPAKFVHCPSNDVVLEFLDQTDANKPQEIFFKYRCLSFPSLGQFFIIVYADQYHARVDEIWHVTVQSMLRVDVHGLVGQGTPSELMVKGDQYSRRVKCFTSHPSETAFTLKTAFQLVPGAYNRIGMISRPLRMGNRRVLVHMVDVDSHELIAAWLVSTTAAAPVVTKTYDVSIPVGRSAHKKIAYKNQWDRQRNFTLRTNEPNLMRCKEPKLSVRKLGKAYIRLFFTPLDKPGLREMFVFVNDETDQNEECLLIKVQYS